MPKTDDAPTVDDSNVRRNLDPDVQSEVQGPQMFTKEQLPDPTVARAAGLAPQDIPANQVIDADDAYSHPRGPEPGEQARAEQRRAIIDRVVENDDVPGVTEPPNSIAARNLAQAAVDSEATSALGKALQKKAEATDDDVDRDEAGREIDPTGEQAKSRELAEKKGMNEGDGEQQPPTTSEEGKEAEKK